MKHLSMLGLAAVAALALMALFGAGPASATVLCKENQIPCPEEMEFKVGQTVDASQQTGTSSIFRTTGGSLLNTCTASTIESEIANAGGATETVILKLTNLTFGSCSNTTFVQEVGELEIHYVTEKGETRGKPTARKVALTIDTILGHCIYGTGAGIDLGTVTGSPTEAEGATIDIATSLPKKEGAAFCPADLLWESTYRITSPIPLYVKP